MPRFGVETLSAKSSLTLKLRNLINFNSLDDDYQIEMKTANDPWSLEHKRLRAYIRDDFDTW